jgi:hypothetical protein
MIPVLKFDSQGLSWLLKHPIAELLRGRVAVAVYYKAYFLWLTCHALINNAKWVKMLNVTKYYKTKMLN